MSKAPDHLLLILDATWGTQNASVNVRNFLQTHITHNHLSITVGDENWPDPNDRDKRADKFLNVLYWDGTQAHRQRARQGELLELTIAEKSPAKPQPALPVTAATPSTPSTPWPIVATIAAAATLVGFLLGLLITRSRTKTVKAIGT